MRERACAFIEVYAIKLLNDLVHSVFNSPDVDLPTIASPIDYAVRSTVIAIEGKPNGADVNKQSGIDPSNQRKMRMTHTEEGRRILPEHLCGFRFRSGWEKALIVRAWGTVSDHNGELVWSRQRGCNW